MPWAEGRERKILWDGFFGFGMDSGLDPRRGDGLLKVMEDVVSRPKNRNDNETQQREQAPRRMATYCHPETAAQCTPGFVGLRWPYQEKFIPDLFLFFFVNFLTVSEAQTNF